MKNNNRCLLYKNPNSKYKFIDYTGLIPIKNILDPINEMKKYNVIFGGICRNVEKYIDKNIKNIDECGKKFNSYAVVIYENDSNDKTRSILLENKKDNYHYIFENNIKEPFRTIRLANGRNKILNKVRELNINNDYEYLIMIDLDDVNYSGRFINTLDTCFEYSQWDVLTGNQSDIYYDLWALRKKNDMEQDCCYFNNGLLYVKNNTKFTKYNPGELLEVDSAFGGIAIYKIKSIPSTCLYVGKYKDGSQKCEHVDFNVCIKKNGGNIYINTSFLTN